MELLWKAAVQGIVQGITEFLPVSSTAHLLLFGKLLDMGHPEFVKIFNIVIQLASILAIAIYFRNTLIPVQMFRDGELRIRTFQLWGKMIVGVIPILLIGAVAAKLGWVDAMHERPLVMVIGEGPGENEDLQGLPFVGKAGQYLDKWLAAIGLSRETNVYITNTVKCRPPQNRDPYPEEKTACFAYLKQQIALIRPASILCLGKPASTLMTGQPEASMNALHGRFFFHESIPMICTYHPAAVLRDLSLKRPVWDDLKKLARYLGLETGGSRA